MVYCWRSIPDNDPGGVALRNFNTLRSRIAALLAALLLAASAPAQERVTLNFVNAEIDAVARAIGQLTGKVFIVDPRVKGTLTLNVEQPMSPDEALAALSAALRLQGV